MQVVRGFRACLREPISDQAELQLGSHVSETPAGTSVAARRAAIARPAPLTPIEGGIGEGDCTRTVRSVETKFKPGESDVFEIFF